MAPLAPLATPMRVSSENKNDFFPIVSSMQNERSAL